MSGVAGAQIGTTGQQPVIGVYVQDALDPTANTNYAGVNAHVAWDTNVIEEDYAAGFTAPVNDNVATGGIAQWVKSASALIPTDKVAIASGIATLDNSTGTHNVFATVAIDQFFWAVEIA